MSIPPYDIGSPTPTSLIWIIGAYNLRGNFKFLEFSFTFSPFPFTPYRPMPGLVWSKQNFEPSAIPYELEKLNLISGKF